MRVRLLFSFSFFLLAGSAFAQITANGQVFLPGGQPARQEIRIHVQHESGRRGPYSVYTDLMGRFELRDLASLATYRITVETDDQNWATTTVNFIPTGVNPRLIINLQPLRRRPEAGPESVSVGSMLQRVPPEARKEYEAATKHIRKNDYAAARPYLEKAIEIYPQFVDARNEMGVALMRENKLEDAETHLRLALEVDPAAVNPLMNLGLCLSRQARFEDALPVLEKAVQVTSGDATGHLLLGVAQLQTGKLDEAEATLKKSYALGGKKVSQAHYYLTTLYVQRNDPVQAAGALEAYLRDNPNDPNATQLRVNLDKLKAAATAAKQ